MNEVEAKTAELSTAKAAQRVIEQEREDARRAALAVVNEQFRERIAQASMAVITAEGALRKAKIAATENDPAIGRIVTKVESRPVSKWSRKFKDVTVRGVVEQMKQGTEMPLNQRYRLPEVGQLFVRLFKANGTPGVAFERYDDSWSFVEEEVAA